MDTFSNPKPQTDSPSASPAAEHARHALDEARASAQDIAARGSDAVRGATARTRESLSHTTDQAAQYVQAQPMKSLMMAATAGAAIALLASALSRHHGTHH